MNLQLLIFTICLVVAFFYTVDYFNYIISKAPVSRVFNKNIAIFGFMCTVSAVYYILNNFKFF